MSTYSSIASQTLSATATSITFNGIPQGYTDLFVVFKGTSSSGVGLNLRFNNDTTANYSRTYMYGSGSGSPVSGRETSTTMFSNTLLSSVGHTSFNINGYSNSTTWKTALWSNDYYANAVLRGVGVWRNTNPITSLSFSVDSQNISSGTVVSLYGLAGGQAGAKASGGVIATSGAYTYHTFATSGAFVPNEALTVDYLVVAGGGGGAAGGGGAGGLRSTVTATGGGGTLETALSLTTGTTYRVIVGAGATGGIAYGTGSANGGRGSYSAFSNILSIGGGGGGAAGGGTGIVGQGGSGGGASYSSGQAYPGIGTANQGFDGGQDTQDNSPYVGPGGGGAGAVGSNPVNGGAAGAGGVGVAVAITGSSVYYAGGGGGYGYTGGTAGAGGNGGGGTRNTQNDGTANTGGGGSATSVGGQGGSGGSGIVIVRYLT